MKLKELHIRNIASIERADIDFEKGLNDAITGDPASIFLISGDTGAGKSVILDGISMALYKNTPRISGVANKKENNFTDTEGETISINSIEQYTRLGISEKDECYSEVVFEGNDEKNYTARLELGITKGRKDENGICPLKHSSPKWIVKIGNEDWQKVEAKSGQPILDAIGLTFEQFGRMAMLAQGQFANFLTGDKKEREAILEQLTNTEHFSDYGEAIKSLFGKAKDVKAIVLTEYETEKKHILPEEEVERLAKEKQANTEVREAVNKEISVYDSKLKQAETIRENKKKQTNAQEELQRHQNTFRLLSADIAYRQEQVKVITAQIVKDKEWLSQYQDQAPLFEKAGEICLKIKQYGEQLQKVEEKSQKLKKEQEKTASLKQQEEEAIKRVETATKAVDDKQKDIDLLVQKRKAMNPQAINEDITKSVNRETLINGIHGDIVALKEALGETEKRRKDIQEEEQKLDGLKAASEKAEADYQTKNTAATKANKRLTTMEMSIDEKIVMLRQRLYEEQTEICPLCGQHIDHIDLHADFDTLLDPLREEQKQAQQQLEAATKTRDESRDAFNKAEGALNINKKQLATADKNNASAQTAINAKAVEAGFDSNKPFDEQITKALNALDTKLIALRKAQSKAEELQNEINQLQEAKRPLDEEKTKADTAKTIASTAVTNNTEAIDRLQNELNAATSANSQLANEISGELATYADDWQNDLTAVSTRLKKDAEEFKGHQKQVADNEKEQGKAKSLIGTFSQQRDHILQNLPDWDQPTEAKAFVCQDITSEWTILFSKVNGLIANLEVFAKNIKENTQTLETYFAETGMNEELLQKKKAEKTQLHEELIAKIAATQQSLDDHNKNVKNLKDIEERLKKAEQQFVRWDRLNNIFGGTRFRTLVQTYILRPLLNNANIYLEQITDRYHLTCSEDNEQLSILVLDRYNKNQVRSVTVLSGGERFMISLALSLALSSLNRSNMNVNILFIDEGFGTLDQNSLESVMSTLEKLQEIAGQSNRRVGIISHREELDERIPVKIQVVKKGEGRSMVEVKNS